MAARRVALLIATYDYEDAGLRRLTAPAHDAEALAAVLERPDIAGFEVTTLVNEPHYRAGEAIADLYRDRRRDDLTLLYFTGHGLKDDDGRLYLATANTRRDNLLFTSLPAEQIDQAMSASRSRQNVLILDCCYSGAFPTGGLTKADAAVHTLERFRGQGRTILTASDATEYSFEGDRPHGAARQSVFTHHLVTGLREGAADLDGDGDITVDELYSYVHDRVVDERPQQRPKKQDNVEGRIVIARNVNWTLPPHLARALTSPLADDRLAALEGLDHLRRTGNAFVRGRITDEYRRLAEDDSRVVSVAARARLGETGPGLGAPPPAREQRPEPEPESVPVTESVPVPVPPPPPTPGHAARLWRDLADLGTDVRRRAWDWLRRRVLADVLGLFPAAAAALLTTALVLDVRSAYDHLSAGPGHDLLWYVGGTALTALAAAVCAYLPRTRGPVAQGLTLGAAVASVWGLVYFCLQKADSGETAFRLALAGHVVLAAGACVTAYVLIRGPEVRFELRRPADPWTWIAVAVGGLAALSGAAVLARELYEVARAYVRHGGPGYADPGAWPYLAAVVGAVCVPLWAAVTAPRRFGVSLLTGWLAGACAIAVVTFFRYDDSHGTVLDLAAALLVLAAAAAFLALRSTTAGLPRLPPRSVLVTALAVVPLLAAGGGLLADQRAHAPVREAAPFFVAVSPDGKRLYVISSLRGTGIPFDLTGDNDPGELTIVDTATRKTVRKPLDLGKGLAGVAVGHGGDYAYVASVATDSVIVISGLENRTVGKPVPVGDRPTRVTAVADGRRVVAVGLRSHSLSVLDTTTNTTTGAPIDLGKSATSAVVGPDGRVYVSRGKSGTLSALDSETGRTTRNLGTLGFEPETLAISPDGRHLYAVGGATPDTTVLTALDTTTGRTSAPVPLGIGPHFGIAVSPNGRRAYVANFFGTTVSAIDTDTNAAVGEPIPVGSAPADIAISPDNEVVYVALPSQGKVATFRAADPDTVSYIDIKPR
ncbi:caspase, EACC1-associated type [Streptomyces sp. 7R007]